MTVGKGEEVTRLGWRGGFEKQEVFSGGDYGGFLFHSWREKEMKTKNHEEQVLCKKK